MNQITYLVNLTPENAPKIDAINRILLGTSYITSASPEVLNEVIKPTTETVPADKSDKPVTKATDKPITESPAGTTMVQLKAVARKAKSAHGEDFVKSVIEANGVELMSSLGRCMSKIPVELYDDIIAGWEAGPLPTVEPEDDLGDDLDDDLDGDAPTETVTAEAVKLALKAMSQAGDRDGAKTLMTANGATKLSDVDNCTPEQLSAIFKGAL